MEKAMGKGAPAAGAEMRTDALPGPDGFFSDGPPWPLDKLSPSIDGEFTELMSVDL
ncbi:hypothetical protein [Kitasatospora sp. LaBMicrA B282]|uniref:hypothetical protein n=1 Tax=Kitasatospora sp. LaBMicrA B282 TaxID=3420949 RepID=UPI003D10F1B4